MHIDTWDSSNFRSYFIPQTYFPSTHFLGPFDDEKLLLRGIASKFRTRVFQVLPL